MNQLRRYIASGARAEKIGTVRIEQVQLIERDIATRFDVRPEPAYWNSLYTW